MAQVAERMNQTTTRSFDAIAYMKHMEAVGFTRPQAEALAEEQTKLIDERLATKDDLERVRLSMASDLDKVRITLEADGKQTRIEVEAGLREAELRMTVRLGGMIAVGIAFLAAIKYFG